MMKSNATETNKSEFHRILEITENHPNPGARKSHCFQQFIYLGLKFFSWGTSRHPSTETTLRRWPWKQWPDSRCLNPDHESSLLFFGGKDTILHTHANTCIQMIANAYLWYVIYTVYYLYTGLRDYMSMFQGAIYKKHLCEALIRLRRWLFFQCTNPNPSFQRKVARTSARRRPTDCPGWKKKSQCHANAQF